MLLNAHSTAVMARLGKVIGNTMTNVSPSNLKLIGRATFLIQSHVNDVLARPDWVKERGHRTPISYGEANAVLFDAIAFLKGKTDTAGQTAEVGSVHHPDPRIAPRGARADERGSPGHRPSPGTGRLPRRRHAKRLMSGRSRGTPNLSDHPLLHRLSSRER